MDQVGVFIYAYGYPGIFALLMLGIAGLPVPDEWILVFSGYLVFRGYFHAVPALAVAVLGSICGISVSYGLGRTLGDTLVRRYGHRVRVTEEKMRSVQAWFDRTGRWSLLVGYFIPGIRHMAGFAAGASKLRYLVFAFFAYTGAFVWSATFVAVGYFFGKEWAETGQTIHRDIVIGAVLAAIMVLVYLFYGNRPRRKE
jgi:membrane protein DedA with SNARE-associated domain